MKRLYILSELILILLISSGVLQAIDVPAGSVSGTWTKANSPYLILGDITIESGQALTIEPGVTVDFTGYFELRINGEIRAIGAENDTIRFTRSSHALFYTDLEDKTGSWNGIYFSGSDNSIFYCCEFSYAKAIGTGVSTYWGGAMYIPADAPNLMIRACRFSNNYAQSNGGAIAVNAAGRFTIDSCLFSYNSTKYLGGAVFAQDGEFYLKNCELRNNSANEGGAIGFWGGSDMKLYSNLIHHNTANHGGAIGVTASTFTAVNNIIANNHASSGWGGAIRTSNTAYPRLKGNLIVNNTASGNGGALFFSGTNAIMTNNTIAYNTAGSSGGGCYISGSSPDIQNCILYFNTPSQLHIGSSTSIPNIYYSDLAGGIAGITGSTFYGNDVENINADPDFKTDPAGAGYLWDGLSADWALTKTSPCLNSGNPEVGGLELPGLDVYDNQRIRNSIVDQGAAETHIDFIGVSGTISSPTYWLADTIRVLSNITVNDNATLTINPGSVVQFQDFYQLNINGRLIAKGTDEDTIRFTVPKSMRSTGWDGIRIDNSGGSMFDNDSTIIDRCILEYAKNSSGSGGALEVNYFSKLRVSNSVFQYDSAGYKGAGIHVSYCSPLILRNLFRYNHANRGAVASSYGSPAIIGNSIVNNTRGEYVGGLFGWWSDLLIKDNFIANNEVGIYIFASNTKPYRLVNNVIVNNESTGITVSGQDLIMVNNTVANNDGGISFSNANLTIVNSVFSGNGYNSISSSSETIRIYNCLVEGGLDQLVNTSYPQLEESVNTQGTPQFINPTIARGMGFPTYLGDWQLYSISPCINAGANSFFGVDIPAKDILGNPRPNLNTLDIGAIENQNNEPAITSQPIGGIKCTGDTIEFSIAVSDTVYYQWQKEGNNIPGAHAPWLVIDSLVQGNEGNYRCVISNAYGEYSSGTVLLIVKEAPDLLLSPESQWVRKGSRQTLTVIAAGTRPILYQWFLDGDTISGGSNPDLNFPSIGYNNEGTYHCDIANVCGTVSTEPATYYVAPEICMVTVDSVTGKNLIVWEKQTSAELLNYNVYKEGVIAGLYELIGVVPYDKLSVFVDSVADPTSQAYWYKITATDASGRETGLDLCIPHKTIHLLTTSNPETGATQLDWDRYIGFNYGTYNILRSSSEFNFSAFHSMASSTTTWSDLTGGGGTYFYRVAAEKTGLCSPTGTNKAGTGPYTHSLSNMDDNKLKAGNSAPDTILLDNHEIEENNLTGALVGKLITMDVDTNDTHSYELVSGTGDEDNGSFTLLGDALLALESFDYEAKSTYSVRVRSIDPADATFEIVFVITILDVDESVGIDEVYGGQLNVYPNPFHSSTILSFPNPGGSEYTLYITDLSGKVQRMDKGITGTRYTIERRSLERGYYLFELRGEKIYKGRFIIE